MRHAACCTARAAHEPLRFHYDVDGNNFTSAGEASVQVKKLLRQMGFSPDLIRRISIAMYEGEINMVIHAGGGQIGVDIDDEKITAVLTDHGPGIENVELAMQDGWSTATEQVRGLGFGAGMGLPNMKRNADGFAIESEVGKGTDILMTFNI